MSGNGADTHSRSPVLASRQFRFSTRSHLAHTIHWYSWEQSAFAEAARLNRPIFLLITSSWCQWCHIMDETTLSDPTIIAILNGDYIAIRVDGDLRPDINQRYNQNGWPSVILLSCEGEILWGGVYVPPQQMLYYLGHVRRYYSEHRGEITRQVRELHVTARQPRIISRQSQRMLHEAERTTLMDLPVAAGVVLQDLYDEEYGGFTVHPHLKFPHPEALELLLVLAQDYNRPDGIAMVCYSLEQMVEGGLWDKEEGGFFRYSAASDWSMPHTEKMLEENAALLRLTLLTAQVSQDDRWYMLAQRLLAYINSTFWQGDVGAFAGSQSADEEYYEPGLYSRASKSHPAIDKTIYTSWNARMISTYLQGAQVLNDASLQEMGLRALDWLCEHMVHSGSSMCHYMLNGQAGLPGQLADQVWMTCALLDAYDLTQRKAYLEMATALMHFACRELLDEASGLFYDVPLDAQAQGRLALREQPLLENSLAAAGLLRLAASSQRNNLRDSGLLVLSASLEKYLHAGIQGALYARVVAQAVKNRWL